MMMNPKEALVMDCRYSAEAVARFSDDDAAELLNLERVRGQTYDAAFDALAVYGGADPADLDDHEIYEVSEEIDQWNEEIDQWAGVHPVTIQMKLFEDLTSQIIDITDRYADYVPPIRLLLCRTRRAPTRKRGP